MYSLETRHLTLTRGQKTLATDLNLRVKPGSIIGILGENGSGKTTLLHALCGLYPPQKGDILLRGETLATLSLKERAAHMGVLFQDTEFTFAQTVWEYALSARYPHLAYFQKETANDRRIVQQALVSMGLEKVSQRNVTDLSGGEKQRLALASLFAQTPALYLLDEPTNHLDIRHQLHVLTHLHSLAKNEQATIILTLHDINLAQQFCDTLLLLTPHGQPLYGPTATLLTAENLATVYQCAMMALTHNDITYWVPAVRPHYL